MSKLRDHLERLRQPVEVDAIEDAVDDAERAVRVQVTALGDRIAGIAADLRAQHAALIELADKADTLDDATGAGKGLMATIRATLAQEQIEASRDNAARELAGAATVLARRVERAATLDDDLHILEADIDFAVAGLRDLARRARRADLTNEAELIGRSVERLGRLAPRLRNLTAPLAEPVRLAQQALEVARFQSADLRSTERASTLSEAVLGGVLPGQEQAREALTREAALAEVDGQLDAARESVSRDEELRRAAEAELDALEWDP